MFRPPVTACHNDENLYFWVDRKNGDASRRPPVVGLFIAICPLWLAGRGISARVYKRSGGKIFAANSLKYEIILPR
jgi:hypothetical protein